MILDDYDMLDEKSLNILNDAIKRGEFETLDGEKIDISKVTFIFSVGSASGSMGFEGSDMRPNVSKDILELVQSVQLEPPTEENKEEYFEYRMKRLIRDLERQDIKLKNRKVARSIIGSVTGGYDAVNKAFRQKVMPIVIKSKSSGKKTVDLLAK